MKKIKTRGATLLEEVASMSFVIGSFVARAVVALTCSLIVAVCTPAMADESQVDIEAELTACASPALPYPEQKVT